MARSKHWKMNPFGPPWVYTSTDSSEFKAIREHARDVWLSNKGEPNEEREKLVRASLVEMGEWLEKILGEKEE